MDFKNHSSLKDLSAGSSSLEVSPQNFLAKKFVNFDHRVLEDLRSQNLEGQKVLVAVSGGADSVALLLVLYRLRALLDLSLSVSYIHHGRGASVQVAFRDKAFLFVKKLCSQMGVSFYSNGEVKNQLVELVKAPQKILQSEADLRDFRYSCLNDFVPKDGLLMTGHNADDLLETQLIQCIRGVGFGGLAQREGRSRQRLNPLNKFSRKEIKVYLNDLGQDFLEDPSNEDILPLRNWLRNCWLPQLEKKRAGSLAKISQSFQLLANDSLSASRLGIFKGHRLDIKALKSLPIEQQSESLIQYIKSMGLVHYKKSHIDEFLKRLGSCSQSESVSFYMISENWKVEENFLEKVF